MLHSQPLQGCWVPYAKPQPRGAPRADGPTGERRAEEGVAALAFSARGERIAALSPSPPTLRVWALTAGWSERLQRGPAVLLPTQARARLGVPVLAAKSQPGT